jgi:hypothetical protein
MLLQFINYLFACPRHEHPQISRSAIHDFTYGLRCRCPSATNPTKYYRGKSPRGLPRSAGCGTSIWPNRCSFLCFYSMAHCKTYHHSSPGPSHESVLILFCEIEQSNPRRKIHNS